MKNLFMRMQKTLCTLCGRAMKVPEHYLDHVVRCESCGQNFAAYTMDVAKKEYARTLQEAREREAAESIERERLAAQAELMEIARQKRERAGELREIIRFLEADPNRSYNELDADRRDDLEYVLSELMEMSESERNSLDVTAMRLIAAIPGRMDALTLNHQQAVEKTLRELVSLMSRMSHSTASIASHSSSASSKLDRVSKGTTMAGVFAAQNLSDRLHGDE
jgi:hypothetical protein